MEEEDNMLSSGIMGSSNEPDYPMNADDSLYTDYTEVQEPVEEDMLLTSTLLREVESKYYEAQSNRNDVEARWLESYQNFRGIYGKNVKFRESEKSRVFIKITKAKVVAAFGQIIDVLFGNGTFPLEVTETKVPSGIAKYVSPKNDASAAIETDDNKGNLKESKPTGLGYSGDGRTLKPGATMKDIMEGNGFVGELDLPDDKVEDVTNKDIKDPQAPVINPAKIAAEKVNTLIHDQIEASNGVQVLRDAIFEGCLLGTGIVKGPFTINRELPYWEDSEEGRTYSPIYEKNPHIEYVSVWDFFPDPNATNLEDAEWVIQRHKLNRTQLRALGNRPLFDADAINVAINLGTNYTQEDYEMSIKGENDSVQSIADRYEVLEYWGVMEADTLKDTELELDEEEGEVQVNIWVCNGKILRVALNPFQPYRLPYNLFHYEKNPYSIFGVGVAENMNDSQMIMNGHARMAIDNLALSGNLVFDIDESALAPGQDMTIYPGKKFIRQAGMPGQAIYGIKFPNTATENMQMFDKFRQIADETTGMPSYSHGQTGVQSTTRTAAGMSMLMGAASLNIKTVVRGIDENLLGPLGKAYYYWNLQFYEGELPIRGDLDIVAKGTTSLMNKETKNQKLQQLLQVTANPAVAPLVKIPTLIKELAKSLDLDPDDFVNSPEEAALYAKIMGQMNPQQQPQQGAPVPNDSQPTNTQLPQATGQQPPPEGAVPEVPMGASGSPPA